MFNLTPSQLREAADLQEEIAQLQSQLAAIIGTKAPAQVPVKGSQPAKRKLSPAHLAKIKAAQKKRWAKFHALKAKTGVAKTAAKPVTKPVKKAKTKISPEGIARIKAAQKARWAKVKAAKAAK
jgi:hypothetical protein